MVKVLAVDDSPTMHRLFKMIFNDENYELKLADNGQDGLDFAKEMLPDIILLDFIMPKMNGFHFCKAIRDIKELEEVPVLLITSKADDVGDKFINKFSNIDCIAKPFQPDELLDKMNNFLNNTQNDITVEKEEKIEKTEESKETENIKIDIVKHEEVNKTLIKEKQAESANINKEIKHEKINKEEITSNHNSVINQIIAKVENEVLPTLRTVIERFLKFQTGYMISDISGEEINIQKFKEITLNTAGELIIFNNEKDYHFIFENGKLFSAYLGNEPLTGAFELFQDVSGLCLLEVDSLQELQEQLTKLELNESLIQKCYKFYLLSILSEALNTVGTSYYVNEINIPNKFKSNLKINTDNLIDYYNDYVEERTEINKILFDDFIIPLRKDVGSQKNLTDFEKNIIGLCNGRRNLSKILSYFGKNKQFVKNTIGMLILTGYLEIGGEK